MAFAFEARPLFVPAVALIGIGAIAPAWVWCAARGASARRILAAHEIVEDQALQAKIEVRRSVLGLPGAEVIDPLTSSRFALSGPLSPIRGGRSASVDVVAQFPRRGEHLLAEPSLEVSDPLELARVSARTAVDVAEGAGAAAGGTGALAERRALVAARQHRGRSGVGDDGGGRSRWVAPLPRRHPRQPDPLAGARARRRADRTAAASRRRQSPADRPRLEPRGRLAGAAGRRGPRGRSLTLELGRGGGCGLLLPGDQRPTSIDAELARWPAAYRRLARVTAPGRQRRPALGPTRSRSGPVLYVTPTPQSGCGRSAGSGGGAAVLVVPHGEIVGGRPRGLRGRAARRSRCRAAVASRSVSAPSASGRRRRPSPMSSASPPVQVEAHAPGADRGTARMGAQVQSRPWIRLAGFTAAGALWRGTLVAAAGRAADPAIARPGGARDRPRRRPAAAAGAAGAGAEAPGADDRGLSRSWRCSRRSRCRGCGGTWSGT